MNVNLLAKPEGRTWSFPLLLIMCLMVSVSCQKDEDPVPVPQPADPGDSFHDHVHIHGMVMHHSRAIPMADVYYKMGEKDFPGSSPDDYDAHVQADSTGAFHLDDLPTGNYYFYGTGWDAAINDSVFGGIPTHILGDSATTHVHVPVTE